MNKDKKPIRIKVKTAKQYRIRDIREDQDMKQEDVAEYLNITQQQYSKLEMGITDITGERIVLLSKLYDVSADYLLGISRDNKNSKHLQ